MFHPNEVNTLITVNLSKLTTQLTECLKHIQKLEDCYMVADKFSSEFKVFLQMLHSCFTQLVKNATLVPDVSKKNLILLCLSQISKSLNIFSNLLCKPLYRQGVWYVCERLRGCVSELRRVCCASDTADESDSDSGWFLQRVDDALQLLEAQGSTIALEPSWTQLVNDIICQAVTIAKIATELDYNEITSACHRILEVNSHLTNGGLVDSNQLSHLTDSMFNSLVNLEERVNVAILRLALQVFSDPCRPVKQLVRQCGQAPLSRSLCDLDPLVTELDTHIEQLMLIGQFAVSCCDDATRVRGMRCCLASLESVDNYLVPALKALYLTSRCEDKRRFAQLLCDHWQGETKIILSHLDNIIDSTAFTRVVQESVNDLSRRLCGEETKEEAGRAIVKQSWLLYRHLSASGPKVELTHLKQSLLQKSLKDVSLDLSLSTSKSQHASYRPPWLQKKIDNLKEKMARESNNLNNLKEEMKTFVARESPIKNVITPDNRPGSNCETPKTMVETEGDLLTPFLKKTRERNTTLYKRTPRRVVQNQMMDSMSPDSDCSWPVSRPESLVLDISEILDNLSMLADTLSSNNKAEASSWQQLQPTPPAEVMKKYFSGGSFDSQWFSLASVRTDEVSADVDTPERIQDLQRVDEKIRSLKLSRPPFVL